jgi:hypothetical protein
MVDYADPTAWPRPPTTGFDTVRPGISEGWGCIVARSDKAKETYEPGKVGEGQHGWAPDAPGTGEAKDRATKGHKKAFEGNETQEASRGESGNNPDFPPKGVGQSKGRRGEQMKKKGGEPGRFDAGTKGKSQRPVGKSEAGDSTGVGAQEPIDESMPHLPTGDQGG